MGNLIGGSINNFILKRFSVSANIWGTKSLTVVYPPEITEGLTHF